MPRFVPAPQDDADGRDFEEFPEIAAALADLAAPRDLRPEAEPEGRVRPEDVVFDDDDEEGD